MCDNCKNISLEITCPDCKQKIEISKIVDKDESDPKSKKMNLNDDIVSRNNMNLNE